MEIYPATSRLLERVPEPLLAGVLGGVGFMCLALVLLLGSACVISHKRDQRRRKKDEPPSAIYKCSPSMKTSGSGSPDSVLKRSLLPASLLYPTSSSFTTTTASSSSQTDGSSFSADSHHRQKQLQSNYSRGRLTRTTSTPISPPIELISRGPDGRFALLPYSDDTLSVHSKRSGRYNQSSVQRSVSLHSEREDRKPAFVLSVDLPPCRPAQGNPTNEICGVAQSLPHPRPYILDQKASYDGSPPPHVSSLGSNSSLATISQQDREIPPKFPVLPHIRSGLGQPSVTASALVLQMEHERERGNLSRCLKLAQEREELEMELRKYTLERGSARETETEHFDFERREAGANELGWECKSSTLPHRYPKGGKECFGLSQSPFSSSDEHRDSRSLVYPLTLTPSRTCFRASSPASASCFKPGNHYTAPSSTKHTHLLSEEAGRITLPRLSSKHQRHETVEAAPEGYDNSPQSTVLEMQTNDSCSEAWRQNNHSHSSLSTLSFHSSKYTERSNLCLDAVPDSLEAEVVFLEPTDEVVCVEMSVDEPELEVCEMQPAKPMLHHRIASHVQHGHSLSRRGRHEDATRSTSFNRRSPAYPQTLGPEPWRAVTHSSKLWDSKQRSQSLDSRRRKERGFLAPDAWIDSLSQEDCSVASSCRPHTMFWEPQSSPLRSISKSPAKSPSASKAASRSPPAVDALSLKSSPDRPIPKADVPRHYEPKREASIFPSAAKWAIDYREAVKEAEVYLEAMKEASICLPHGKDDYREALELEGGGSEGVPESGSSYSSYASSGRGSMEPANRRLSLCHLSPTLTSSPGTVEGSQGSTEDTHQMEQSQRRKVSVDENYEWDAADFCSQLGNHDDLLPSLNLLKPTQCRSLARMQCSTKAQTHCAQPSLLLGHQSSCSAEPEAESVLF
ncbi:uncharacterized protein LOC116704204 [Etheostoma spectabile]|uniref:uncharacterized protein LOC116704204 n=1 Tax=Etheostoma spectabile TaxID=54343 RepID=UPI0013AE978B|nr:uncharacterized protein LOC116704204 [Etheostoma spectabile]